MTAEQAINQWLEERYLGKRIAGPEWTSTPFTVARVYWDQDYDHVAVWFFSAPLADGLPVGYSVSMGHELPDILP